LVAHNLTESIAVLNERDDTPYSAAWIDCLASGPSLGRSLIHLGRQPRGPTLKRLSAGGAEKG
jgi:decaprenylphospho-beta-D-ribofuranose 2-oxidase